MFNLPGFFSTQQYLCLCEDMRKVIVEMCSASSSTTEMQLYEQNEWIMETGLKKKFTSNQPSRTFEAGASSNSINALIT